jgi:HD-like signal output (HDOD) protein
LLLKEIEQEGHSLIEAEKILLGIDHAELGGRILTQWNFPQSLTSGVRYHHVPAEAGPYEHLAATIFMANKIAHFIQQDATPENCTACAETEPARLLGIDAKSVESLISETKAAVAQAKSLFAASSC